MLSAQVPVPTIVFSILNDHRVNLPQLLSSLELDPLLALQTNPRVERAKFYALIEAMWAEVKDPALGLHLGQQIRPKDFGLIDYAAMNSGTWGQALAHMARYKRLVGEASLTITPQGSNASRLNFEHFDQQLPYAYGVVEYCYAHFISFARWLSQQEVKAQAVYFQHKPSTDIAEYEAVFGCEVLFEQDQDVLIFAQQTMDLKLPSANPALEQQFVQQAEQQLAQIDASLSNQVLHIISEQLGGGIPDITYVGKQLNVSPRTLQRRLKTENTSFLQLLEQTRKRAALTYIKQQQLGLGEVAHLLGFADISSFYRAFKRWTGHAPLAYRELEQASI